MQQQLVPLFNNLKHLRIMEYNYLEKTAELFELLDAMGKGTNFCQVEHLMFQIERVKEIQDNVRLTGLFVDNGGKEKDYYIASVHKDHKEPRDRVTFILADLASKINSAPTGIHVRGAVILLMPILYTEMLSYNEFLSHQNERTINGN